MSTIQSDPASSSAVTAIHRPSGDQLRARDIVQRQVGQRRHRDDDLVPSRQHRPERPPGWFQPSEGRRAGSRRAKGRAAFECRARDNRASRAALIATLGGGAILSVTSRKARVGTTLTLGLYGVATAGAAVPLSGSEQSSLGCAAGRHVPCPPLRLRPRHASRVVALSPLIRADASRFRAATGDSGRSAPNAARACRVPCNRQRGTPDRPSPIGRRRMTMATGEEAPGGDGPAWRHHLR